MTYKNRKQVGRGSGKKPKLALSGTTTLWIYKCQLPGCCNFISSGEFGCGRSRCIGHWDKQMGEYLKALNQQIIDKIKNP